MLRFGDVLARLIVVALLALAVAAAGCTTWGDFANAEEQPGSSVSPDENRSSGWKAAWDVAGREDTGSTECISGPLSSTNKPGLPQSNTWGGGNPVLAPALVLNLSSLNPMRAKVCPAVIGVQR